jgi:hypothetical protein
MFAGFAEWHVAGVRFHFSDMPTLRSPAYQYLSASF